MLDWIDGTDAWTARSDLDRRSLDALAADLAPAWAVLTAAERPAFREAVAPSDAAWIRGRTFELEHAVGGALYYVPRNTRSAT